MALQIRKVQAWSGEVSDRPGAAAAKLEILAQAGADLEFVFTRPHPLKNDAAIFFLAPITGQGQIEAARAAGLGPALDVAMLCVEGHNRPGMAFHIMSTLAIAGINLAGLSISTLGERFVAYLAFDSADKATQAVQLLATLVD
jgi:hypothetical protein